ncbi:MAG: glycosyltransferase family 39 protein [Planctomycetota bacterium]
MCSLVALALVLRVTGLGAHSLWFDECMTWLIARAPRPLELVQQELNPPFAYLVFWSWIRIAGDSVSALRLLPALASFAAVLLGARAAHELAGPRAGLVALLLLGTSPLSVWYGQEVRSYCFVEVGSALLLLAWARRHGGRRSWPWAAAGTFVAVGSHYLAVLVPALVLGVAWGQTWWRHQGGGMRVRLVRAAGDPFVRGVALGLLCWLPWWILVTRVQLRTPWGRGSVPDARALVELPSRLYFVAGSALAPAVRGLVGVGVVVWNLGLAAAAWRAVRRPGVLRVLMLIPAGAVLASVAVSWCCVPVFGVRYLLAAHLWLVTAVAAAVRARVAETATVVLVAAVGVANVLATRAADVKEDFAGAASALTARFQPGDRIVCLTGVLEAFEQAPLRYYLRHAPELLAALTPALDVLASPTPGTVHIVLREAPYSWPLWQRLLECGTVVSETPMHNRVKYAQLRLP